MGISTTSAPRRKDKPKDSEDQGARDRYDYSDESGKYDRSRELHHTH
jgi:hypothetical protein